MEYGLVAVLVKAFVVKKYVVWGQNGVDKKSVKTSYDR
jgi:hypothetical protein